MPLRRRSTLSMPPEVRALFGLFRRDLRLALRQSGDTALVVGFFVLAVVLFPFGVGPEPEILGRIAAGILWVAALLAALLSLDRLFQTDYEDGGLDLIVLSPAPLELAVLAKCAAHWVATGLPLALLSPLLALVVDLDPAALPTVMLSLLAGTPALSLIGSVAAALTLGARRQGILLSLLVLPLYVPPLVFGAGAVEASATGTGPRADLLILGALTLAALALCPWASAAALRLALE
jgi:heme exporter protein B